MAIIIVCPKDNFVWLPAFDVYVYIYFQDFLVLTRSLTNYDIVL